MYVVWCWRSEGRRKCELIRGKTERTFSGREVSCPNTNIEKVIGRGCCWVFQ